MHWHHRALVEVDLEPSCLGKWVEAHLHALPIIEIRSEHQEGVIGILQHRASFISEWVSDVDPGLLDYRLKDICH